MMTMRLSYLFSFILLFGLLGVLFLLHVQDLIDVSHQETTETGPQGNPGEPQGARDWDHNTATQPILTSDPARSPAQLCTDTPPLRQAPPPGTTLRGRRRRRRRKAPGGAMSPQRRLGAPQLEDQQQGLGRQGRGRLRAVQDGRRRLVDEACLQYRGDGMPGSRLPDPHHVSRIYVEDRHRLLYCEVPKAGCSNWKRVLMVLSGLASSPAHIQHQAAHYGNSLRRLDSYDRAGMARRLRTYTKALFVREPLERLVSAFRDKFEQPNTYYHPVFGRAIIARYRPNATRQALRSGSGVTFPEFVRYLLDPRRPLGLDIHWERVGRLCSPCLVRYDFIGRFENLAAEAEALLRLVGAPANLTFPRFKDRHRREERTGPQLSRRYLAQLSADERRRAQDFYLTDYAMFNYSRPFGPG
ncbi:carbohydrate sulfotransferase 8 [Amblyraja radiata]|uniref:carbohydrate sulfotransferase 8 n=1 Tax=Amblyraja radiata TaxID=386614 RepID=UPI001403DCB5|nr:carbohydrate sulfotransferase 8 [Amblyraja radiata]XP_032891814.1 carbohydrate sulfotransferase 8 [Amblyraja radiata]